MPPQLSGRGRTVPAQISAHEKTRSLSAPGLSHWCSLRRPVAAPSLYRAGCGLSNRLAAAPGHRLPPALAPEQRTCPHGGGGWGLLPSVRCLLAAAIAGRPAPGVRPAAIGESWSNISFHGQFTRFHGMRLQSAARACIIGTMKGSTLGAAKASEGPESARDAGQGPIFLAHIVFR